MYFAPQSEKLVKSRVSEVTLMKKKKIVQQKCQNEKMHIYSSLYYSLFAVFFDKVM